MSFNSENQEAQKTAGEPEDVFYILSKRRDSFSKADKKIADCMMNDRLLLMNSSISSLAKKLDVSPASITRFCQKLNCRGFSELKYKIANSAVLLPQKEELLSLNDITGSIITKLVKFQTDAIQDSLLHINPLTIRIVAKTIVNAKTVCIYAEGGPAGTAMYAQTLLMQLGINCFFFSDAQLALSSAMHLGAEDVAMYVCRTGYSPTILRAINAAKAQKAKIIGITSNPNSKLSQSADYILHYNALVENDMRYLHIARMCELAIVGVLYNDIICCMPELLEKVNSSRLAIIANQES